MRRIVANTIFYDEICYTNDLLFLNMVACYVHKSICVTRSTKIVGVDFRMHFYVYCLCLPILVKKNKLFILSVVDPR